MGVPDHLNLFPKKPVGRSRSNSYNQTWNSMVQRPKEGEYEASPRKILALKKFTSVYHHTLRTEIQIEAAG